MVQTSVYRICPKCGFEQTAPGNPVESCPSCGIVFAKWMKQQFRAQSEPAIETASTPVAARAQWVEAALGALFHTPDRVNLFEFGGRAIVWIGLVAWTGWFFSTDYREVYGILPEINESFMHRVDLVFHEAGHVIFRLLGDFMHTLGGSLGQLVMPAIVAGFFVFRHQNPFGGSVGLWWLGQSAMDLAPYINDARAGQIMLLGGVTGRDAPGYHDWSNILGRTGMLHLDHTIAGMVNFAGMAVMAVALAWGAYLLWLQWHHLDK